MTTTLSSQIRLTFVGQLPEHLHRLTAHVRDNRSLIDQRLIRMSVTDVPALIGAQRAMLVLGV